MANDEVLAAVERRREASNGQSSWDAIYGDDAEFDEDWDARDLADAYLAHLAAEAERERMRGEPVTEEWVRSLGFTDADPKRYAHLELKFSNRPAFIVVECDLSIGIAIGDGRDPEYTHVFPNSQPTKVQLLDLLRGLGIEPKREGGGV